ncbi:MAG: alpha-2-macroglobulin family protein [Prevotella sp.]
MRNKAWILTAVMWCLSLTMTAQNYAALWKRVQTAGEKDQPRTQLQWLDRITKKAVREKCYNHFVKARLMSANIEVSLSSDSLVPVVDRLEKEYPMIADSVSQSLYAATLYRLFLNADSCKIVNARTKSAYYKKCAMNPLRLLAAAKDKDYAPLVESGEHAYIFNNDMLSVVGRSVEDYETLMYYYNHVGNDRAACLAALDYVKQKGAAKAGRVLKKSYYRVMLDSLIAVCGHLDVAGEVAVERYRYMEQCTDVTLEDKINYIHYALDRWGGWQRMGELRNAEKALTAPLFSLCLPADVLRPHIQQKVVLECLRNLSQLSFRFYQVEADGTTPLAVETAKDMEHIKPLLTPLPQHTLHKSFVPGAPWKIAKDSILLPDLPVGVYMMEVSSVPQTEVWRTLLYVSNVYVLQQSLPHNLMNYYVMNATTGEPLAHARLNLYFRGNKAAMVQLVCDAQGEAHYIMGIATPDSVYACTAEDKAMPKSALHASRFQYNDRSNETGRRTYLYTDRAVYRPGQTVRVAMMVVDAKGRQHKTAAGETVTIRLRDAHGKHVSSCTVITDEFGKASADFVLADDAATGTYRLMTDNASQTIEVAAYKRPTFQVTFPDVNTAYHEGDTLVVRGRATTYTGMPVQGAKVCIGVRREHAFLYRYSADYLSSGYVGNGALLRLDTVATGNDGSFEAIVPLVVPEEEQGVEPRRQNYRFVARASVTDLAGETHEGELSVMLNRKPVQLTCNLSVKMLAEKTDSLRFYVKNASGRNIEVPVRFYMDDSTAVKTIRSMQWYRWDKPLASGRHTLVAMAEGDTLRHEFVVFSTDDEVPPVDCDEWFYQSAEAFSLDKDSVTIQAGGSEANMYIHYTVIARDTVLEKGMVKKSNALINRKFIYKESYGDALLVTFSWVKEGKAHTHKFYIKRPETDNGLQMRWITFRDKLKPGQKETWKLQVLMPDGSPAEAQLIATLYDRSLDMFRKHRWNTRITPSSLSLPYLVLNGVSTHSVWGTGTQSWKPMKYHNMDLSRISPSVYELLWCLQGDGGFPRFHDLAFQTMGKTSIPMMKSMAQMSTAALGNVVREENSSEETDSYVSEKDKDNIAESASLESPIRKNLQETAFFYPSLHTDETGHVTLQFSLPESVTTWKFMGLAHTRDGCCGQIAAEVEATKPVMVQPQMPRFVREGDQLALSARVSNFSEHEVSGHAVMELIHPETDKVLLKQRIAYTVPGGSTRAVTFVQPIRMDAAVYICRVSVSGKGYSDGEQHYLPVLPCTDPVVVTCPFSQNGPSTHTIDIQKMFPANATHRSLMVEYTHHPAWMVIQALPTKEIAAYEDAIETAATLYSLAMACHIANGSEQVRKAIVQWQQEPQQDEQMRRLAWLMDTNRVRQAQETLTGHLRSLQQGNGSIAWCKGMNGNEYVTVEVALLLGRLQYMAGKGSMDNSLSQLWKKCMAYLDAEMHRMVLSMKADEKHERAVQLPTTALKWMYIHSIAPGLVTASAREDIRYLLPLLKKEIKSQTLYDKAMSALILHAAGETERAGEYVKSLKEYTVYQEGMGRYYDTPRAPYSWCDYRIPTQTAAIEAIATLTPGDTLTLREMQRWLLQEKRTQQWSTPVNTVNAIHAFLQGNAKALQTGKPAELKIDGKPLELSAPIAFLGYVKTEMAAPSGKQLQVKKSSQGVSWGAVYASYTLPAAQIERTQGEVTVKREVVAGSNLKAGDRVVVRITVQSNRDLDFVSIEDHRAACLEPVIQLSGYRAGCYVSVNDRVTTYRIDHLRKGTRVIETEYYVERGGKYDTGTCTATCTYAPAYRGTDGILTLNVAGGDTWNDKQ